MPRLAGLILDKQIEKFIYDARKTKENFILTSARQKTQHRELDQLESGQLDQSHAAAPKQQLPQQ